MDKTYYEAKLEAAKSEYDKAVERASRWQQEKIAEIELEYHRRIQKATQQRDTALRAVDEEETRDADGTTRFYMVKRAYRSDSVWSERQRTPDVLYKGYDKREAIDLAVSLKDEAARNWSSVWIEEYDSDLLTAEHRVLDL